MFYHLHMGCLLAVAFSKSGALFNFGLLLLCQLPPSPYIKQKKRIDPSIGAVHTTDIRIQICPLPPIGSCIDILFAA
jgi:hypothetical protein